MSTRLKTEQFVINDGMGEDDESSEVVFDFGCMFERNAMWMSVENQDGECTWCMTREQWAEFKAKIDAAFGEAR